MKVPDRPGQGLCLFHELVDGGTQVIDGALIACGYRVHHAVAQVVLQNHLAGIIQGGADSCQLNQHFGTVGAFLHHLLHLFQMAQSPGQTVNDGFLVFVDVTMAVGNAVGVEIGMILAVFGMFHRADLSFRGKIYFIIPTFGLFRKPGWGILRRK